MATSPLEDEKIEKLVQTCIPDKDVISKLGKGTYGLVYKVRESGKEYALKTYVNDAFDSSNILEIDTLVRVNHPNVVKTHKAYVNAKCEVCLLLELADSDLSKYIEKQTIQPGVVTMEQQRIMFGLACGLNYIHSNFIVHKDLKPANILMIKGVPKIADFGLATIRRSEVLPLDGPVATVWWRPPEILVTEIGVPGNFYEYTNKVDVWAMGLIFFELITGNRLLECGNSSTCVQDILLQISRRIDALPQPLIDIVDPDMALFPGIIEGLSADGIADALKFYTLPKAKASLTAKRDQYFAAVPQPWKDLILGMLRTDPKLRLSAKDVVTSPAFAQVTKAGAVCASGTIDSRAMSINPIGAWKARREEILAATLKEIYKYRVAFFLYVDILDRFFTKINKPRNSIQDLSNSSWYLAASLYGEDPYVFTVTDDATCEIVKTLKFQLFRPTVNMLDGHTAYSQTALALCYVRHISPDQVNVCAADPKTFRIEAAFKIENIYLDLYFDLLEYDHQRARKMANDFMTYLSDSYITSDRLREIAAASDGPGKLDQRLKQFFIINKTDPRVAPYLAYASS